FEPGPPLFPQMGVARRSREEMGGVPGRSRMEHQARRDRAKWGDRRPRRKLHFAANQFLGGEIKFHHGDREQSERASFRGVGAAHEPGIKEHWLTKRRYRPVFMDSGPSPSGYPGITSSACPWMTMSPPRPLHEASPRR